jgi:hypothetical protein
VMDSIKSYVAWKALSYVNSQFDTFN